MRLICPKCAAQYEVDASAIPEQGREVQCSACGNIWFEPGSGGEPAPLSLGAPQPTAPPTHESQEDQLARAISRIVSEAAPPAPVEPEPAPAEPAPAEPPAPEPYVSAPHVEEDVTVAPVEEAPAPIAPPRPQLDTNVLSILREEAERETEARRIEGTLLPDNTPAAARLAEPVAELRAEPPLTRPHPVTASGLPDFSDLNEAGPSAPAAQDARPDADMTDSAQPDAAQPDSAQPDSALPDAAAIAATLRPASARSDEVAAVNGKAPSSGFRTGFLSVILLAAIGVAVYVFAPDISGAVPQLGPVLDSYRAGVDALHGDLNQMLTEAIALAMKALGA